MHGTQISVYEIELDSGRDLLEAADVVVGVDIVSQNQFLVYGRDALQQVVEGNEPPRSVLYVTLDEDTDELEYLYAACQLVKGEYRCEEGDHEYLNGSGEPLVKEKTASIEDRAGKTDIAIFLFGQPEYALQDYELTGAGIREYASDLGKRLNDVADIVEKLRDDGWRLKVVASNLEATHSQVNNCDEAVARLQKLGIDMDAIIDIAEWDDKGERLTPA